MTNNCPHVFFFWSLVISAALPLHTDASGGFSVDLIHRDSPHSPYFDPSSTFLDRVRAAAQRSVSRASRLASRASTLAAGTKPIESEIFPNEFEYLMSLSLGTPPSKILAIADTGSDLIWTQCKPCDDCYKQKDPLFDPQGSSTYGQLSCKSESCGDLPAGGCGDNSTCQYHYSYGDGSFSDGILSVETVTFESEGKRAVSIPKIKFGCTHASKGTFDSAGSGLVGLGGGSLSLIRQLGSSIGSKFSYCLVPYADNTSSSPLHFGDSAVVSGKGVVTTPLVDGWPDTFYFLILEAVIVGDVSIRVPGRGRDEGNIIIDSGTTLTFLEDEVVSGVVGALEKLGLRRVEDPEKTFEACYDVSSEDAGKKLPDITLKFRGDADVVLNPLNTFARSREELVCLVFLPSSSSGDLSILGNLAQQNFHVGYDLGARTLAFAPADCAKL